MSSRAQIDEESLLSAAIAQTRRARAMVQLETVEMGSSRQWKWPPRDGLAQNDKWKRDGEIGPRSERGVPGAGIGR